MPEAAMIREMFSSIAARYDLLNRVLSLGSDQDWRRRTCDELGISPGEMAADLCCGTGDLALAIARRGARVAGVDFSRGMLAIARGKGVERLAEADCLRLPFRRGTFDLVTVAFGVRNFADLDAGLREIHAVLKPGGRVGILEFAAPPGPVFRRFYLAYLRWVVPSLGAIVSGRRSAYVYLSSSIRGFPDQPKMEGILRAAGFASVTHIDFARGIAALYVGFRPA
ncbi:MAG TPA: bifunctional demethylmenaquinone methyltransferase/2-methoxy-6-polyprenyl-1,4-benzoquinol methylase UbiE [Candidatus Polarisedimenticolia bacterium]|jgi:demethylmenaquinone methyltransferase/2-methoxy-6-polyprenyl-1,4-benzoquinol methylase